MASLVQAILGSVPGRKYSDREGHTSHVNWPVMVQILTLMRLVGGGNPGEGEVARREFIMRRQIGEAPVTPEAT